MSVTFCFERVNLFLFVGDDIIPEIHLKRPGFNIVLVANLLKTKKELKTLYKEEIQIIFTRIILTEFVFSIIWLLINTKT